MQRLSLVTSDFFQILKACSANLKRERIFVGQLGERRRERGMYVAIHEHFEPTFNNADGEKTPRSNHSQ
ncbi:MAG: hypothetical protein R3270_06090 [Gammaproteobacteria bacterium]|nr:hypothetical protein [Gammaproteobacteria bacterium]